MSIPVEAVRLCYLHAMHIPVWKLRTPSYEKPCYSTGVSYKGQPIGQVVAAIPEQNEGQAQVLLGNIMKALDLNVSAALVSQQAPRFDQLGDSVQLVLLFGRELGEYYQRFLPCSLKFGQLMNGPTMAISCTYSLAEMLLQPELKRTVWQQLQTIIKYLVAYEH